jgi:hypothetical protein
MVCLRGIEKKLMVFVVWGKGIQKRAYGGDFSNGNNVRYPLIKVLYFVRMTLDLSIINSLLFYVYYNPE